MHTDDLADRVRTMLTLETEVPKYFPRDAGIWVFHKFLGWQATNELPHFAIGDIETKKEKKKWVPILGVFLDEIGNWYIWNSDGVNKPEIPWVLVGHNALEHDSRFLFRETTTLVIDTMLLMRELFGIPAEKQSAYKKLKQNHAKGLNVPEWFHCVCESSLKESCKFLLGEDLKTTKKDGLAVYCANDVYATLRLSQRLIPIVLSEGKDIYRLCEP